MEKKFYITTAIDYANGMPHIGHAYEKVLADVLARHRRFLGQDVYFLTGLDEHGQKVQQSAQKRGIEPIELCDDMAQAFQGMCSELEISNDDYIRTTQDRHKEVVNKILEDLHASGDIYKAEYTGYYSAKEEQFLQEKDRQEDGSWPSRFGEVSEISESNYFFRLSKYQDWLKKHIENHPDFILPDFRARQVMEFLKEDINDLCISRPKERLEWGIPLPFDPEYVTYVWFDALINYISAVQYGQESFKEYWPVDYHVIGKDILVPAHGIYWPIMLKAMGVEPPQTLLVHGWWLNSGAKMSKSDGNTVDPMKVSKAFGVDPFRYFLIREMTVGQDSDFSLELFLTRYNNDLGNDLGNLMNRVLNMCGRYREGKIPEASIDEDPEKELRALWESSSEESMYMYQGMKFNNALRSLFEFIRGINRYAEIRAPWKLAKSEDEADQNRLDTSLAYMAEGLRLASTMLAPVMPGISAQIWDLLGMENIDQWDGQLNWSKDRLQGNKVGDKCILFPRVELEDLDLSVDS